MFIAPRPSHGNPIANTDKPELAKRRSRNGCYVCRLRRKRCNEGKPSCTFCRSFGINCNYIKPLWWSHKSERKAQQARLKEIVADISKRKRFERATGAVLVSLQPKQVLEAPCQVTRTLPASRAALQDSSAFPDSRRQDGLSTHGLEDRSSTHAAANAFSVNPTTASRSLAENCRQSRAIMLKQMSPHGEDGILVEWLTRLTRTGFPASPALVVELAEEIRYGRTQPSSIPPEPQQASGERWIAYFKDQHPEIFKARLGPQNLAMDGSTSPEALKMWFRAVTELRAKHCYPAECIYNMHESGFAIGVDQMSRALVSAGEENSWKVIAGQDEWMTAIECVNAAGNAIPPLIIFKARNTNAVWIPAHDSCEWRFSTSDSGWGSDSQAYEWLTTVFEPETRPQDPNSRRLLIMNGHGSLLTARVVAHCMENHIDILVPPPCSSHILEPLVASIIPHLKGAVAEGTHSVDQLHSGMVSRVDWTRMYIQARQMSLNAKRILSGWRHTGLEPMCPATILEKHHQATVLTFSRPNIPRDATIPEPDLITKSPVRSQEWTRAAELFISELNKPQPLSLPAKRFGEQLPQILALAQRENESLRHELAEARKTCQNQMSPPQDQTLELQRQIVWQSPEMLEKTKALEEIAPIGRDLKRASTSASVVEVTDKEDTASENADDESDSDCIVVASSRAQMKGQANGPRPLQQGARTTSLY